MVDIYEMSVSKECKKKKTASLPRVMTKVLGKEGSGPLPRALAIALGKEFLEKILKISLDLWQRFF
jgi:hypothetical protein